MRTTLALQRLGPCGRWWDSERFMYGQRSPEARVTTTKRKFAVAPPCLTDNVFSMSVACTAGAGKSQLVPMWVWFEQRDG